MHILLSTYDRINSLSPRTLLKIVLYSYMNGDYSSRSMELNCKRDINFMFLLEGHSAPDHATLARFRSIHFAPCSKRILAEVSNILFDLGEISGEGVLYRMNRSIQAEGSFGDIKQDMQFRRYLSKGTANVLAESTLLAIARNINKLHNKIQNGKTGTHLFPLKSA